MRRFRFALQALLSSLLIVPPSAQYPRAWNSFRDLGQSSSETPVRMIAAPGGGTYMFGVQSGSSTVCLVDDTGALIWSRCAPGVNGDVAAGSSGVAMTGYISRWMYYQFYDLFSVQKYNPQGALLWSRLLSAMPDSASG